MGVIISLSRYRSGIYNALFMVFHPVLMLSIYDDGVGDIKPRHTSPFSKAIATGEGSLEHHDDNARFGDQLPAVLSCHDRSDFVK